MGNQNKILGLILIFLGIIFLLDNLDVIGFNVLIIWPSFIILGGSDNSRFDFSLLQCGWLASYAGFMAAVFSCSGTWIYFALFSG